MQYRNNKTRPAPIFRAWEDSPTIRIILAQRQKLVLGLTLVEMVIAMAIMAIIFAAVLPQFRVIQNSWDSQAGAAETLQNGRVLIDHLHRNLSKAVRITAVSGSAETNGYIEFIGNDANNVRYDVNSISDYVEFGLVGNLSDLAGPVSQLQFTCYDALDLSTPITDVNAIRNVKVDTTLINLAKLDQDMTFTTQAYIRTNALPAAGGGILKLSDPWPAYSSIGLRPALAHMSGNKYICAYKGDGYDGFACILTVNPADWSVSATAFLEYSTKDVHSLALAKIDDNNFLCAYRGFQGDGFASILYEMPAGSGTLRAVSPLEFDTTDCVWPALSKIYTQGDDHHYLCAYFDNTSSVRMVVLNVTIVPGVMMELTNGPTTSFACDIVCEPALIKIDDTHHLCAYRGSNLRHWAVVLTVDPATWTVTTETPFEVTPTIYAYEPDLAKIDDTHYLYALHTNIGQATAVVLTVNTGDWTITKAMADPYYQFSGAANSLELCKIDGTNFLCAYGAGFGGGGLATILTVNTSDWSMSHGAPFTFEAGTCLEPALCQIDIGHYLCAHAILEDDGFAGVLELGAAILP